MSPEGLSVSSVRDSEVDNRSTEKLPDQWGHVGVAVRSATLQGRILPSGHRHSPSIGSEDDVWHDVSVLTTGDLRHPPKPTTLSSAGPGTQCLKSDTHPRTELGGETRSSSLESTTRRDS